MATLSIVIPALNEEGNLSDTLSAVTAAAQAYFGDYEIIVVNDGSTDRTGLIAEDARARNPRIRIVTHRSPRGFGASFDSGRQLSKMEFTVMVHGDNAQGEASLRKLFSYVGKAEVVMGVIGNPEFRGWSRRIISAAYTGLLNCLFQRRLRYYNGLQVHRTEWLRSLVLQSTGFGFQAEVILSALRAGKTCVEVPILWRERPGGGATKLFKPKNVVSVLGTLWRLCVDPSSVRKPPSA
jgi:glycosyltransferase involved in cell wall biosynthesis